MQSYEIIAWLKDNPDFFETHADELAEIYVPHLHRGQAISLTERQLLILRQKNLEIETQLSELLQFGKQNDTISEQLHRLTIDLMHTTNWAEIISMLEKHLCTHFGLSKMAMRLWLSPFHYRDSNATRDRELNQNTQHTEYGPGTSSALPELNPVGEGVLRLAQNLVSPHCSTHISDEVLSWFGACNQNLKSFAQLALRENDTPFGLLILASECPKRFDPHMGTLYLQRLSELVATALLRTSLGPVSTLATQKSRGGAY